jgi:predicted transcriptional regulator
VSATQGSSQGERPVSGATAGAAGLEKPPASAAAAAEDGASDGALTPPGLVDGATKALRDPAAVRQFIERFTSHLVQTGFPRTPARIFVALLTADSSSMTAAELAEVLQASPASVSGGARYLVQVGLIVAEGEAGSRRQHYRMPESVWQDIVELRERQFSRWSADLRDGVQVLGADSPAGVRMAQTVRYFEFITGEMAGLLARWQQRSGQSATDPHGSASRD